MHIDESLFWMLSLTGLIFLGAGFLLWKKPPAQMNYLYGYRTNRSMRSQAHWNFAQVKGGKELVISGCFLIGAGVVASFFQFSEGWSTGIGLTVIILGAIGPIWRTERALRREFEGWNRP